MKVLLPPSETKRDGGEARLDLGSLSFPELTAERRSTLSALRTLSRSVSGSMAALKLGPTQRAEVDRNRAVTTSGVMPALDRYTGVLYDALDASSLSAEERAFAGRHVVMGSALFGALGALDEIPAYRLSHNTALPDLSLRRHWRGPLAAALTTDELVIDLRSDSYVALGPVPGAVVLRVVSESADGRRTALSHFNKSGKGRFTRALVTGGVDYPDLDSLIDGVAAAGWRVDRTEAGADLVV